MQGVYEHVKGVRRVYAGYTGGAAATAQYEIVSTGATGHAESVQIIFDPAVISYGQILQIYFSVAADPTELNYQGPDSGTQYRSEIWYASRPSAKDRGGLHRPVDPGECVLQARSWCGWTRKSRSTRRKPITRISWSCTRTIPISR